MLLTACALASLALAPAAPSATLPTSVVAGDHGKITWFQGSWDELMAQAASQNKMVFIDFWTDWCYWCKELDKKTFSSDDVAKRMEGVLCYSIDAESEVGAPLAKRFAVSGFPSLVLLAPNGEPLDKIGGFLPPEDFIAAVDRVARGEGTLASLRKQVDAEPKDIDKRFAYAQKAQELGVASVYDQQLAAIRELDPNGKSLPLRRIAFGKIFEELKSDDSLDTTALVAFLNEEKHDELLFDGWRILSIVTTKQLDEAKKGGDNALAASLAKKKVGQLAEQWKHVSSEPSAIAGFGNMIAWQCYELADYLDKDQIAWALGVAQKAVDASEKEDPNVLDTLACLEFVSGNRAKALELIELCIRLEPENSAWKDRKQTFETDL